MVTIIGIVTMVIILPLAVVYFQDSLSRARGSAPKQSRRVFDTIAALNIPVKLSLVWRRRSGQFSAAVGFL